MANFEMFLTEEEKRQMEEERQKKIEEIERREKPKITEEEMADAFERMFEEWRRK